MKKILLIMLVVSIGLFANEDILNNEVVYINQGDSGLVEVEEVLAEVDFALEVGDYIYAERVITNAQKTIKNNDLLDNYLIKVYTAGGKYKESYNLIKKKTITKVDKEKDEIIYNTKYPELFLYQVENLKYMISVESSNWRKDIYEKELYSYYETYIETSNYTDSEAIYDLGNLYMEKEMFQKALEIFEKDKNKDYRNIFGVAVTSRFLGNYKKSIDNYTNFINLKPEMYEAYLGLAQAYQLSGDFARAITYYEKYLEYKKDERVYIVMANIEIARERLASASGLLEEGQKAFPNSKTIEDLLIEVYSKLGR